MIHEALSQALQPAETRAGLCPHGREAVQVSTFRDTRPGRSLPSATARRASLCPQGTQGARLLFPPFEAEPERFPQKGLFLSEGAFGEQLQQLFSLEAKSTHYFCPYFSLAVDGEGSTSISSLSRSSSPAWQAGAQPACVQARPWLSPALRGEGSMGR